MSQSSLLTRVSYTAEQDQTDFAVPFGYIHKTHVQVYINSIPQTVGSDYTWLNDGMIQFTFGVAAGADVYIRRRTPIDARFVVFQDGSFLNENHMNTDSNQMFYKLQEILDWSTITDPSFYSMEQLHDILWGWLDGSWFVDELRKPLWYLQEIWGWSALFEPEIFEGDVWQNVLDALPDRIHGAEIRLDDAEHTIDLQAGYIDEINQTISNAQITMDGMNALISLKADQVTVEELLIRMTGAEIAIDGVEASITLNVMEAIHTLEGTVNYQAGQLALLTNHFYVKLDNNGYVTGFGLYNDGPGESGFIVMADKFGIIAPGGTGTPKAPFVVDTETGLVGIDGALIVKGSIAADRVMVGDIDIFMLQGASGLVWAMDECAHMQTAKQDAVINDVTLIEGGYLNTSFIEANSILADAIAVGTINLHDLMNAIEIDQLWDISEDLVMNKVDAVIEGKTLIQKGFLNTAFIEANSIVANKLVIGGINALQLMNGPSQAGADKTSLNTSFNTQRVGIQSAQAVVNSVYNASYAKNLSDQLQTLHDQAILGGHVIIQGGYLNANLIGANTIFADHIIAGEITTEKINGGAVTTGKIGPNAVSSSAHYMWHPPAEVTKQGHSNGWFDNQRPWNFTVRSGSVATSGYPIHVDIDFIFYWVWNSTNPQTTLDLGNFATRIVRQTGSIYTPVGNLPMIFATSQIWDGNINNNVYTTAYAKQRYRFINQPGAGLHSFHIQGSYYHPQVWDISRGTAYIYLANMSLTEFKR